MSVTRHLDITFGNQISVVGVEDTGDAGNTAVDISHMITRTEDEPAQATPVQATVQTTAPSPAKKEPSGFYAFPE